MEGCCRRAAALASRTKRAVVVLVGDVATDELQGHVDVQRAVPRQPDRAHAALAELRDNLVLVGRRRRRGRRRLACRWPAARRPRGRPASAGHESGGGRRCSWAKESNPESTQPLLRRYGPSAAIQRRIKPEQMTRTPQPAAPGSAAVQIRPMGWSRLVHGSGFLAASVGVLGGLQTLLASSAPTT